jgi:hypothetical protein
MAAAPAGRVSTARDAWHALQANHRAHKRASRLLCSALLARTLFGVPTLR